MEGFVFFGGSVNLFAVGAVSGARLPVALDHPFVGGDLLECHGAAGMELLRGDAYLGTESELGAVGEAGGRVPIDAGGIDLVEEALCRAGIVGDDALAVARAVAADVEEGFVERIDHPDGHAQRQELGAERLVVGHGKKGRGHHALKGLPGALVGLDAHALGGQLAGQHGQEVEAVAVDDEAVEGIADGH